MQFDIAILKAMFKRPFFPYGCERSSSHCGDERHFRPPKELVPFDAKRPDVAAGTGTLASGIECSGLLAADVEVQSRLARRLQAMVDLGVYQRPRSDDGSRCRFVLQRVQTEKQVSGLMKVVTKCVFD